MPPETETDADSESLLQRIETALQRAETAAAQLDNRCQAIRQAAQATISGLDRAIALAAEKTHG
jgi:hypothetical protein